MKRFGEYARYYDLFYGDKDYKHEAEIVDSLIKKYCYQVKSDSQSILNLGCGTGKHDNEFSLMGYRIKGIDLSREMVNIAINNYQRAGVQFDVGDVRSYSDGKEYDICTSLFHVLSYQTSNSDIINSFNTANRELKKDGLFIFDCWYGPGVLSDKPVVRVKKVEDDDSVFIRHAIPRMYPEKNVVDVNYDVLVIDKEDETVKQFNETHSMRYLFTPEVELMLTLSGFELLACLDCSSLQEVTYNSWTAYFVARKIKGL